MYRDLYKLIHRSVQKVPSNQYHAANPVLAEGHNFYKKTWFIILSLSAYWYNYRHAANALGLRDLITELGVPSNRILLGVVESPASDSRNTRPGSLFLDEEYEHDLHGEDVHIDMRGIKMTRQNIVNIITRKVDAFDSLKSKFNPDASDNIVVYVCGHGGVGYLKNRDWDIFATHDFAKLFSNAYVNGLYSNAMFILDTCKASTMIANFDTPNAIALASSSHDENSYALGSSVELNVSLTDKFTYHLIGNLRRKKKNILHAARFKYLLAFRKSAANTRSIGTRLKVPKNKTRVSLFDITKNLKVPLIGSTVKHVSGGFFEHRKYADLFAAEFFADIHPFEAFHSEVNVLSSMFSKIINNQKTASYPDTYCDFQRASEYEKHHIESDSFARYYNNTYTVSPEFSEPPFSSSFLGHLQLIFVLFLCLLLFLKSPYK